RNLANHRNARVAAMGARAAPARKTGVGATRHAGECVAAVSKARRLLDEFSGAKWLWRDFGRRNGPRQNTAGARVFKNSRCAVADRLPVVAGLQLAARSGEIH